MVRKNNLRKQQIQRKFDELGVKPGNIAVIRHNRCRIEVVIEATTESGKVKVKDINEPLPMYRILAVYSPQ